MKVRFWGTRGSIPAPGKDTVIYGGNTTCVEITLESGARVIIDSGSGIRALGDRLSAEGVRDIHLLMTHMHWDHLLGFPFFSPLYDPAAKIAVDGFPTCMKGLKVPFETNEGFGLFPVRFRDIKAEIRYIDRLHHGPLEIDNVIIDTIPLQHPQGGFGYRFREGKKTLVFITDNELTQEAQIERHSADYVGFCKDVDILIHDAQYKPDEMKQHKGWGHSDYVSALNLALNAHAKRLILFHHDPSRKDQEVARFESHCRDIAKQRDAHIMVDAAMENSEFTL
ncbi:MAG: MBL fold metallo-hydrolase [Desulfobacterales bacterium]|nr:MBL fold metallo-hydrolase [Desulfobacterales bacterium]